MKWHGYIVAAAAAVVLNGAFAAEPAADREPGAGQTVNPATPADQAKPGDHANPGNGTNPGDQATPGNAANPAPVAKITQEEFVKQVAAGNQFGIDSSKLAMDKGDDKLKSVAKMITSDHQKAQDELKKIAQKQNITVSSDLSAEQKQMLEDLKGKDGDQFKQAYLQNQQQAHQQAIKLFTQASTQLQNKDLMEFAQQQLPKLQEHQAMIQDQLPGARPAGSILPGNTPD